MQLWRADNWDSPVQVRLNERWIGREGSINSCPCVCVGAIARTNARFGQGSGPIFFDDLKCTGLEYRVFDCPSRGIEVSSGCSHSEDAGVTCVAGKNSVESQLFHDPLSFRLHTWRS